MKRRMFLKSLAGLPLITILPVFACQKLPELKDTSKVWLKNMNGFVWVKLTSKLLAWFGMGFWTRAGSESAIIATKGKPKPVLKNIRAVRHEVAGRHSAKPAAFRQDIVDLCGDVERIELFAREKTVNWDCWGFGVDGDYY